MKRVVSSLMLVVMLMAVFGLHTAPASAKSLITFVDARYRNGEGIVFIFDATGYKNRDVKGSSIFVGSNFHSLGCQANKQEEKIVCIARGGLTQYAGQTGIIHLAGQLFYVPIPELYVPEPVVVVVPPDEPLVCDELETPGAYVHFIYGEGEPETIFIAGSTLEEVKQTAQNWMDQSEGYILSFEIVSDLVCGAAPQ